MVGSVLEHPMGGQHLHVPQRVHARRKVEGGQVEDHEVPELQGRFLEDFSVQLVKESIIEGEG